MNQLGNMGSPDDDGCLDNNKRIIPPPLGKTDSQSSNISGVGLSPTTLRVLYNQVNEFLPNETEFSHEYIDNALGPISSTHSSVEVETSMIDVLPDGYQYDWSNFAGPSNDTSLHQPSFNHSVSRTGSINSSNDRVSHPQSASYSAASNDGHGFRDEMNFEVPLNIAQPSLGFQIGYGKRFKMRQGDLSGGGGIIPPPNDNSSIQSTCDSTTAVGSISPLNGAAPPAISPVTPIAGSIGNPVAPISGSIGNTDFAANNSFPGNYNFRLGFTPAKENHGKKTISYTYAEKPLNKLYIRVDKVCPISFLVDKCPPDGSTVRAMAFYARPQDLNEVVKRCMNHGSSDTSPYRFHLIRCENALAKYIEDPQTSRHSVYIPYQFPPAGSTAFIGRYKFMCFSSCTGTINRRPMQLVFTLEHNNTVLGRQVLELRICACPGRDRQTDEENLKESSAKKRKGSTASRGSDVCKSELLTEFTTLQALPPPAKQPRSDFFNGEEYIIRTTDRHLYKLLKNIKENYETAQKYNHLVARTENFCNSRVANLERNDSAEKSIQDIDVKSWLESLDLGKYAEIFYGNNMRKLSDLDSVELPDLANGSGIPKSDWERIYSALIQFRARQRNNEGSLSLSSSSSGSRTLSQGGGGFRIARTVVRSAIPKQEPKANIE